MFSLLQSRTGVVHIALKMTRIKAVVDRVAATVVALFPILTEGVKYKFENYANTELGRQKPTLLSPEWEKVTVKTEYILMKYEGPQV